MDAEHRDRRRNADAPVTRETFREMARAMLGERNAAWLLLSDAERQAQLQEAAANALRSSPLPSAVREALHVVERHGTENERKWARAELRTLSKSGQLSGAAPPTTHKEAEE